MRYWLLLIACFILTQSIAQKEKKHYYSKQFSLGIDNDAFMLKLKDGYYTNGVFLQLSKASQQNIAKIITRWELGQTMFTTGNRRAVLRGEETIDRPYCGYLYLKYGQDKFNTADEMLSWNVSVGATGRISLAQQLQDFYHQVIHLYYYPYWETQIPNGIGVNLGFNHRKTLASSSNAKIVSELEANLGMAYTNARIGANFCIGAFENNDNSALFATSINSKETSTKRKHEFFAYFHPQVIGQAYNATLQGMLFQKTGDAITSKPSPFMYQQTFGLVYAKPRWTAKLEATYQTKETPLQNRQQRYGGIHFAYRFN
jgi:lipid A 3-O-deacylase